MKPITRQLLFSRRPITLELGFVAAGTIISADKLTVTRTGSGTDNSVRGTKPIPPQGAFWEVTCIALGDHDTIGIGDTTLIPTVSVGADGPGHSVAATPFNSGRIYTGSSSGEGTTAIAPGQTMTFVFTAGLGLHRGWPVEGWDVGGNGIVYPLGSDIGADTRGAYDGPIYPMISLINTSSSFKINFGDQPWVNTNLVQDAINAGYKCLRDA